MSSVDREHKPLTQAPERIRILGAPSLYLQGPGALEDLGRICGRMGRRAMVVADETVWQLLGDRVLGHLATAGVTPHVALFNGQCCYAEIDRLRGQLLEAQCDHIVGLGGGKAIDTVKGVSIGRRGCPLVIVPTIAASDAATSRICVVYTPENRLEQILTLPFNPAVVLVDSLIIAKYTLA
jgi:glycerol dehydrogenase